MARKGKQVIDILNGTEPIEVTKEEEIQIVQAVEQTNIKPEIEVEIVKPKVQEQDKTKLPTPIYDIPELTEEDKNILIEKRVKNIISQTQIPYYPALIKFKEPETTAIPPMYALVDFDHRFVDEAWDYYKTNVRNPYVKDFLQLVEKAMGKPNRIFTRLVFFNYE